MHFTTRLAKYAIHLCALVFIGHPVTGSTAVDPNTPFGIEWVRSLSDSSTLGGTANAVAIDSTHVFVGGSLNTGFNSNNIPHFLDTVIQKYDFAGNRQWSQTLGSTGRDEVTSVSVLTNGNVLISGRTDAAMPGNVHAGSHDAFIATWSSNGTPLWVKQFGSASSDGANGSAPSTTGGTYVVGGTSGTMPGATAQGDGDAFVAKYDAAGNQLWLRQFGSPRSDGAVSAAVDQDDNVYIIGRTRGYLLIPGSTALRKENTFLAKYDPDGNQEWIRQSFLETDGNLAKELMIDAEGSIYTVAWTRGENNNSAEGGRDMLVAKHHPLGFPYWVKQIGTEIGDFPEDIALAPNGDLLIAGSSQQDNNSRTNNVTLTRLDPDGNVRWRHSYGTLESERALSIEMDESGAAYLAVFSDGDFGGVPNNAYRDGYLVKLSVPEPGTLCLSACLAISLFKRRLRA